MKRFLAGAILATLIAGPASAADVAMKAPGAVVPVYYNWSGFYVGAHVGYGWDPATVFFDPAAYAEGLVPGLDPIAPGSLPTYLLSVSPDGALGGIQFGYNFQNGQWVFGLEVDFSIADIKQSTARPFAVIATIGADNGDFTGNARLSQELDYFGTVRGRFGWAFNTLLLYATGGLAWGHFETTFQTFGTVVATPANFSAAQLAALAAGVNISTGGTNFGFAVGGGFEWAFAPRWSIKGEYLYLDFGSDTVNVPGVRLDADYRLHVARAGLNWRFGP